MSAPQKPLSQRSKDRLLHRKFRDELAQLPAERIGAGEVLYLPGAPADGVYGVRSGLVMTSLVSPTGREVMLHVFGPGDTFGELCLCSDDRGELARALQLSEVVKIRLTALIARLREDPDDVLEFVRGICERLVDAHERIRTLCFEPVRVRLARTLLGLADAFGRTTPEGTQITQHVTQEEIARMIGARREVTSTLLNRLRDRRLLGYTRRGLIVVDRDALRALVASTGDRSRDRM